MGFTSASQSYESPVVEAFKVLHVSIVDSCQVLKPLRLWPASKRYNLLTNTC